MLARSETMVKATTEYDNNHKYVAVQVRILKHLQFVNL